MTRYLVSACLAGFPCSYDGKAKPCAEIVELYKAGLAQIVCPESLSGLPVPREPTEKRGDKYYSRSGRDVTANILAGAEKALNKALNSGCRKAILKSRSPSCGICRIYDGTFTGNLTEGNGAFAAKLLEIGFEVYTEESPPEEIYRMLFRQK